MKALKFIKENKIFFITFGIQMLVSLEYLWLKEPILYVDDYYYPLYVINYNCGYCSRLLVGAFLSLFFRDNQMSLMFIVNFTMAVYIFFCFIVSLFINHYLKNSKYQPFGIYYFFIAISPAFLAFLRILGTLDLFWMGFVLGALWLVDKKGWRWLVPVFCVISLCIYELFVTTYLPIIAIAVFYQFVKKPNVSNFIYIAVCAAIVGLATIYFMFIGNNTMKMTSDQMVEFARGRLNAQGSAFNDFYLRSVFFWEVPDIEGYSGFAGYIKYNFDVYIKNDPSAIKTIIFYFISNTIMALPFFCLFGKSFKNASNFLEKFTFLCCFSTFPFMVINLLLSTDTSRFSIHFLLASFFLLLFFVMANNTTFSESYDEMLQKIDQNKTGFAIISISIVRIVLSGVRF